MTESHKRRKRRISRNGSLMCMASHTDPRAWSLDPLKRQKYFLDTLIMSSSDESSLSNEEEFSFEKSSKKDCSMVESDNVKNLEIMLDDAGVQIEKLNRENKNLNENITKRTTEMENLRSLVKNLYEQMIHLESIKAENKALQCELGSLSKVQIEISHLKREVDILQKTKTKFNELVEENRMLESNQQVLKGDLKKKQNEIENVVLQFQEKTNGMEESISALSKSKDELKESSQIYKTQLLKVLRISNRMIKTMGTLRNEMVKKEKELAQTRSSLEGKEKELKRTSLLLEEQNRDKSRFVPYMDLFFEIKNAINLPEESLENKNKGEIKDFVIKIQSIVNSARKYKAKDVTNTFVQTLVLREEKTIQVEINKKSTLCQTLYPDEYVLKYNEACLEIEKMSQINNSLVENNRSLNKTVGSLEIEISNNLNSLKDKVHEIEDFKKNNDKLQKYICDLHKRLQSTEDLLAKALSRIEIDTEIIQSCDSQCENLLKSTTLEYETYVTVLDSCLEYKQSDLTEAGKMLENKEHEDVREIERLKTEIESLNRILNEEKKSKDTKIKEIDSLHDEISKQSKLMEKLNSKLVGSESIIDNFIKNFEIDFNFKDDEISNKLLTIIKNFEEHIEEQKEIKINLEREKSSKQIIKRILKISNLQKKNFKEKISQLKINTKRVSKIIVDLRGRLGISEKLMCELQFISDLLTSENNHLKKKNTDLIEEIGGLKIKIMSLEGSIKSQENNLGMTPETKKKMEKIIVSLMRKLTKYKNILDKKKANKGTMTNEGVDHLNNKIDTLRNENLTLSTTINKLQEKLTTLFDVPEKETQNVEIQCEYEEVSYKNVKTHYEAIIKTLQTEHTCALEQTQEQSFNNLRMVKSTYERDMNALKKTNYENLEKLQSLHEEEKAALEKMHKDDLERLKTKFELTYAQKEDLFKVEKDILTAQLSKTLAHKNAEIKRLKSDMSVIFKRFKTNCKTKVKKLKEKYTAELKNVQEKCRKLETLKVEKKNINEKYIQCRPEYSDKECLATPIKNTTVKFTQIYVNMQVECGSQCSPKLEEKESYVHVEYEDKYTETDQYNGKGDIENSSNGFTCETFPDVEQEKEDEKDLVLSKNVDTLSVIENSGVYLETIAQLRGEIDLLKQKYAVKASAFRREQLKVLELEYQYQQELEHSAKVLCRLGAQFNKAKQLEIKTQTLSQMLKSRENQIKELENDLDKEKDKTLSLKNELNKLNTECKGSYQLEMSIERIKKKIEKAVLYEKRLNEYPVKGKVHKAVEAISDQAKLNEANKVKRTNSGLEQKVIMIQTCGVVQYGTE